MKHRFTAVIFKVGINPCVKVPRKVSSEYVAEKGYIYVKGTVNGHAFTQTLVPVKGEGYRLYVNAPMLKGGATGVGKRATFEIELDAKPPVRNVPMHKKLNTALVANDLLKAFDALPPSRRKEINRYLHNLKSSDAVDRNIERVIRGLRGNEVVTIFRLGTDL